MLTGRVFEDLRKYPKLIGGLSEPGAKAAQTFYEEVLDFDERPDLERGNGVWDLGSAEAAEMAKLAETTYRDVNIGLANQFAVFAEKSGIDVFQVIEASNSQPYSHIHRPGISVGGHCIPVYPRLYLSNDPDATVVRAAREANVAMPSHAVDRFEAAYGDLKSARVVVLGVSYRGGVKETAFSGVFPTVMELERRGAIVTVHDPLYANHELISLGFLPHQMGAEVDGAVLHTRSRGVLLTDHCRPPGVPGAARRSTPGVSRQTVRRRGGFVGRGRMNGNTPMGSNTTSRVRSDIMLIGGSGRSGTTILCRTFARHPQVSDVPEWRFTTDPDGVVDFYTQCTQGVQSPFHFDVRIKRLESLLRAVASRGPVDALLGSSRVRRAASTALRRNPAPMYARTAAGAFSPNFEALSRQFIDRLTSSTYDGYWVGMRAGGPTRISFSEATTDAIRDACRVFLEGVAEDVCRSQGVQRHLEKNTWNILCWHRTRELLPEAKLVHIVRDPRDVVSSFRDQPWVPSDAVASATILSRIMAEWERVRSQVPPDSYREVRLEDLTADPVSELSNLCDFWNLDWDPALLQTKLSSSSFGRWRTSLTAAEQREIRPLVDPLMERYGYE